MNGSNRLVLGLQGRVLLLAGAGITAAALLAVGTLLQLGVIGAERQMQNQARTVGAALAPVLRDALLVGDLALVERTFDDVMLSDSYRRLALLDGHAKAAVLEGRPRPEPSAPAPPQWFRTLLAVRTPALEIAMSAGGESYGVLLIEPSPRPTEAALWEIVLKAALPAIAVLAGTLALLLWMLRSGLKPLRALAASALKFGAGDFSRRAPESSVREVALTAQAFNRMADSIQALVDDLQLSDAASRRLAGIVEQSGEAILTADLDGTIMSWNPAATRLFGYSAVEAIGQPVAFLLHDEREDAPDELETLIRAALPGDHHEARILTRDARLLDVALSLAPLLDESGRRAGLILIGRDVTESKRAEEAIRQLNETLELRVHERTAALQASNKELEAFSYSVSHDLRAPLRAIDGFGALLEQEWADRLDDQGRDYLQRIRTASQRMARLIEDLLDLARISRQALKPVRVDLSALCGEICDALHEQAPGRKVACRVSPGLEAQADPVLIRVVLDNLLRNAWKFTAERDQALIEVGSLHADGAQAFYVRDNGAGFRMDHFAKLFQPFQRLHEAQRFEGTGIGLAIVQRIVHRHGGWIWAEGAPDQGASFYFTLPDA